MTVRLDCITLNCLITTLIFSFQRNIQRIKDLVRMEEEDRRALLRTLSDDEYRDVMNVCATMPNIEMTIKSEGITCLPFIIMILVWEKMLWFSPSVKCAITEN